MIQDRQSLLDPEIEYLVLRNVTGVTLSRGQSVCFDSTAGNANGVGIVQPYAAGLGLYAGIVHGGQGGGITIENQAFGRVLVSGFCDYALVQSNIAQIISIGDQLGLVAADYNLYRLGPGIPGSEVVCLQSIPTGSVIVTARVMVRAGR